MLIQMYIKKISLLSFQSVKQLSGITAFAIISRQHVCRHRLSKATWSADTYMFFICIQNLVHIRNQPAFIYINSGIHCFFICMIARIHKYSHAIPPPFASIVLVYHDSDIYSISIFSFCIYDAEECVDFTLESPILSWYNQKYLKRNKTIKRRFRQ